MLSASQIPELKQQLRQRSWKSPMDEGVPGSALNAYLKGYGFDRLMNVNGGKYCAGYIPTELGEMLVHRWEREAPKGTVLVVHGLFDHVGLYLTLVEFLVSQNYSVLALDMPGHGLSDGERVSINSYDDYGVVIKTLLRTTKEKIDTPLFCVAQSNGSAAMMSYLLQGFEDNTVPKIEKIVMLAPLVRARGWWKINVAYCLLSRFLTSVKRNVNDSSHDNKFNQFIKHNDPLQVDFVSVKWVGALRRWIKKMDGLNPVSVESLAIQGGADGTVDTDWNWNKIKIKFNKIEKYQVAGAYHHLVNESEEYRFKVFDEIHIFLNDK